MCSLLSALAGSELFFCILFFVFQCSHFFFLGTADGIKQTDVVLLRCTVMIFLFYLDLLMAGTFSLVFIFLTMTQIILSFVRFHLDFFCLHLCLLTSKIATVIILEYACILFTSPSRPTLEQVLDRACSQFISSDTHNAVKRLFRLYSTQQLIEFILTHRLR